MQLCRKEKSMLEYVYIKICEVILVVISALYSLFLRGSGYSICCADVIEGQSYRRSIGETNPSQTYSIDDNHSGNEWIQVALNDRDRFGSTSLRYVTLSVLASKFNLLEPCEFEAECTDEKVNEPDRVKDWSAAASVSLGTDEIPRPLLSAGSQVALWVIP